MNEKRKITSEDLPKFAFIGDPQLQPNGDAVFYTKTTIDEDTKEYRSRIWSQSLDGEVGHAFTGGPKNDSSPRFSPDGERLAFVSDRSGTKQIWVMPANGGEAQQLTFIKNGVSAPVWSPDGKWLAFTSGLKPDETLETEEKKDKKEEKKDEALVVNRLQYKSDGAGFWGGRYSQLFIIPADGGEVKQLTTGEYHVGSFFWSQDSQKVGFTSKRAEDPDMVFYNDLYFVSIDGGELIKLTESSMMIYQAQVSPDGQTIAFLGSNREYENATLMRLYVIASDGGEVRCVTEHVDQYLGDVGSSDMRGGISGGSTLQWHKDGKSVYVLSSHHGDVHLYEVDLDGNMTQITQGNRHVFGFSYDEGTEQIAITSMTPVVPGELYLLDGSTKTEKRLTEVNQQLLKELSLSEPEEFWYDTSDGWKVQGWIMKPFGYEEGKKYPMVLEVHGGPHTMYSNSFFHEFQLLAAQGYVVLYTNPRGGHGYGQKFVDACRGDYGGKDYEDLMEGVDYALANYAYIDEDQMVVTGGSYGGFMTNWIVGHTDRFKAAVTQRSISNWISFYGVSDIGYYFTEWQILGNPWDDFEKLWHHSPLKYVDQINTPLLILHSERDFRCPIEQAEQLFIAIKRIGKTDTELIRFPNSNHDLSRSGNPKLRLERLNRMVGWFNKYLDRE